MSITALSIELERHATFHEDVYLPRTAEQAAWVAPALIAAGILVAVIVATVLVRRATRERMHARRVVTWVGVSVAVLAATASGLSLVCSRPEVTTVTTTKPALPFMSTWETISDATLHNRIEQQYGIDVPDRYLERITKLTGYQGAGGTEKPIRIIGEDGSAVRECDVWITRTEPVTIALHCD